MQVKPWLCACSVAGWVMWMGGATGCATAHPVGAMSEVHPQIENPAASDLPPVGSTETGVDAPAAKSKSVGHKVLWYLPNRLLDLVDVFRFRLRVGPGIAYGIRVTNQANFFIGRYETVYFGLPGPRLGPKLRSPVGLEQERGLLLMGVDATDDLPHEPGYSPTEFTSGLQALIIGGEWGVDPVELGDFLMGFLLFDIRQDDR